MQVKPGKAGPKAPYPGDLPDAKTVISELQSYASHYVAAQLTRVKVIATNVAVFTAIGVVAGVIGIAVVFTAAVLLCIGIADGLGQLFGRMWLGQLVFGLAVIGLILGGLLIGLKIVTKSSRRRVAREFTERKRQQRRDFGADVHDRAAHLSPAGRA